MASIEKRGENTYRIVVSAGYGVNGKKLRKRKTIELDPGLTERQAKKQIEKLAAEFERQVETGQYLDGGKITLQEFAERWMQDYAEKQLAPQTILGYRILLEGRIIPALGHIPLQKLQPSHIIEFYNNLEESGMRKDTRYKAKQKLIDIVYNSGPRKGFASFAKAVGVNIGTISGICKGGKTIQAIVDKISAYLEIDSKKLFEPVNNKETLKSSSISHYHRLLSSLLSTAVHWQLIIRNPVERVKPPKVDSGEPNHYDEEQVEKLFELADKEHIRMKTIIYLVLFVGMRLGELAGLEWKDFDFDNKLMQIRRASQYLNDKSIKKDERIITKKPKNKKSIRVVSIPQELIDVLKEYKRWQNEERLKLGDMWQREEKVKYGADYNNDRLFTKYDGSPIFPKTPYIWFKKFREKYNLPPLTFHQLRHTNASLLIAQDVDIVTVGKRLGHATPTTTMKIYAHALQRPDREAVEKLANRFGKNKNGQSGKQA